MGKPRAVGRARRRRGHGAARASGRGRRGRAGAPGCAGGPSDQRADVQGHGLDAAAQVGAPLRGSAPAGHAAFAGEHPALTPLVPTAESIRGRCAGLAALAAGQTGLLPEAHARRDCSPSKGTDLPGYAHERPVTESAPGLPPTPAAASAASIARGVLGGALSRAEAGVPTPPSCAPPACAGCRRAGRPPSRRGRGGSRSP